ncbi:MAG: uL15 family ribosomal protein [Nanoarchaeota archaeon]|nr:uL15 family ribosomal protein [Nanoarchaeota archaeon]
METKVNKTRIGKSEPKGSHLLISKSKIERRMKHKMDASLVETIILLKKTNPVVAKELARPKRRWPAVNLKDIDMVKGDVLVAGKVLSAGELSGAKKIVAWAVSAKALEKIKEAKGTFITVQEEMKKNPQLNGYDILR